MKKKKLKASIRGLENALLISRNSTSMWHQECDVIEEKAKSLQAELDIARAELADAHSSLRSSKALEDELRQDYCIKNDALDETIFKIKELEFALEASRALTGLEKQELADAKSVTEQKGCLEDKLTEANAKLANIERLYNASVEAAGGFQNDLNKALAELESFRAQEARLNEARADLVAATRKWAAEYQDQRKDDVKRHFDDADACPMRFVQPGDGLPLESFSRGPGDLDASGADGAGERGS